MLISSRLKLPGRALALTGSALLLGLSVPASFLPVGVASARVPGPAHEPGWVNVLKDLRIGEATVNGINAARSVHFEGSAVRDSINAGKDVTGRGCDINGSVRAGGSVRLINCPVRGSIQAGHDTVLDDTRVLGSVQSGQSLSLTHSTVDGNAAASGPVQLENSDVLGTLITGDTRPVLENSRVGALRITGAARQTASSVSSSSVSINNGVVTNGSVIGNGQSRVRVGSNSQSMVNGFTVRSTDRQTTVIAPDGSVYVNGGKVGGPGPGNYAEYRAEYPGAPVIEGPGWRDRGVGIAAVREQAGPPDATVTLRGNSVIAGDIVFEQGYGIVRRSPGSRIDGQVVNGSVEPLR